MMKFRNLSNVICMAMLILLLNTNTIWASDILDKDDSHNEFCYSEEIEGYIISITANENAILEDSTVSISKTDKLANSNIEQTIEEQIEENQEIKSIINTVSFKVAFFDSEGNEYWPENENVLLTISGIDDECVEGVDEESIEIYEIDDFEVTKIEELSAENDSMVVEMEGVKDYSVVKTTNEISGQCGDDLYWKLTVAGDLTITGTGVMNPDGDYWEVPWGKFKTAIKTLSLPEGLTGIGENSFEGCVNLSGRLNIPSSVVTIGAAAFKNCYSLTGELAIPQGVTWIGDGAFSGCSGFTGSLIIPKGVNHIGAHAFSGASGLTGDLIIPKTVEVLECRTFESCNFSGKLIFDDGCNILIFGEEIFGCCSSGPKHDVDHGEVYEQHGYCRFESMSFPSTFNCPNAEIIMNLFAPKMIDNKSSCKIILPTGGMKDDEWWVDIDDPTFPISYISNGTAVRSQSISFVSDGEELYSQRVLYGQQLTEPEKPVKEGHRFIDWWLGECDLETNQVIYDKKWNFEDEIIPGMTLYARWIEEDKATKEEIRVEDISSVPESLRAIYGEELSELQNDLRDALIEKYRDLNIENTKLYDVQLKTTHDGGITWENVSVDDFPESGIDVCIQYPEGTYYGQHLFSVSHIFEYAVNGHTPGEIEFPEVWLDSEGIHFHVSSLSPVMIGWVDKANIICGDVDSDDIPDSGVIPDGLWVANEDDICEIYNGKSLMPEIRVYKYKRLLRLNVDYTLTYSNNVNVYTHSSESKKFDANKAPCAIVKGKGNYTGTEKIYFRIYPKNIESEIEISDFGTTLYTGNNQMPVPKVVFNKKNLVKSKDYTIVYYADEDCRKVVIPKEIGTYYVRITGQGNYDGEVIKTFIIASSKQRLMSKLTVGKLPTKSYTGDEVYLSDSELTIYDGKTKLIKGTDYSVEYENNVNPGTAKAIITGIGDTYVGTKTVTFKIAGTPLNKLKLKGFVSSMTYPSRVQGEIYLEHILYQDAPPIKVLAMTRREYQEHEWEDEEEAKKCGCLISYENNSKAGKATLVLQGINGYEGTIKKNFIINPFSISNDPYDLFKVELDEDAYDYTKVGAKPEPIVTFRGVELNRNVDYKVSYVNNTILSDSSTKKPTVKITGIGNFKGVDTSTTFNIVATSISSNGIVMTASDKVYSNKAGNWKSSIVVTDNGKKLSAGKDFLKNVEYTYAYIPEGEKIYDGSQKSKPILERTLGDAVGAKDIVPVNTIIKAKVTAMGKLYTGYTETTYRVIKKDINKLKVVIEPKEYSGKAIAINADDIKFYNGKKLVTDVEYEIDDTTYLNNLNTGKASVIIRGLGEYGGSKKITFTIKQKGIKWWRIEKENI